MRGLFWNLVLALAWMGFTERFSPGALLVGFVLGFFVLYFARSAVGGPHYAVKVMHALRLFLFMLWELVLANLRVAYDVLTPTHHMRPGVLAIPLEARTDLEITLLANLITLTPGTLTLDVSLDRRFLYIHVMYIDGDDLDAVRRKIKQGYERRVLEVLR